MTAIRRPWMLRWGGVLAALLFAAGLVGPAPAPVAAASASLAGAIRGVSAGAWHACAIREDGTLACWGNNGDGQAVPVPGTFTAVSAGVWHTCAIRDDGTLACWGYNGWRQASPPDGAFTAVSAGGRLTCALQAAGTVRCWGEPYLTDDTPGRTYTAVEAGYAFACGLRVGGIIDCWGSTPWPIDDQPTGAFTAIAAGVFDLCALRDDGSIECWGESRRVARHPTDAGYVALDIGQQHACALRSDGTLTCWGDDADGRATPPGGAQAVLSVGLEFACAIDGAGFLACWGDDGLGQVTAAPRPSIRVSSSWATDTEVPVTWSARAGLDPATSYDLRTRDLLPDGTFGPWSDWLTDTTATSATLSVAPGATRCVQVRARDAAGRLSTWQGKRRDACATAPLDESERPRSGAWTVVSDPVHYGGTVARTEVPGASLSFPHVSFTWAALLATTCPTCGSVDVFVDSRLVATVDLTTPVRVDRRYIVLLHEYDIDGLDTDDVTITLVSTSNRPVMVDGLLVSRLWQAPVWADSSDRAAPAVHVAANQVRQVVAGFYHTCAVLADGSVACWGMDYAGMTRPPAGAFTTISVGVYHACGLRPDGSMTCWGSNDSGAAYSRPGPYLAVGADSESTCVIREDGTLRCWGWPYQEAGLTPPAGTFRSIDAAGGTTCGIRTDDTLVCWGLPGYVDVPVAPDGTYLTVAVRGDRACAIALDSSLVCFGNTTSLPDPPDGSFVSVDVSYRHACAVRDDGTAACWGDDVYFQSSPPAGAFASVTTGAKHSCAVAQDGTFACWGQDLTGQVTPAPTAGMDPVPSVSLGPILQASWAGRPILAPITGFDVSYRVTPWDGRTGAAQPWLSGTSETAGSLPVEAGATYCLTARATDASGLTGDDSPPACSTTPLDDRALDRSKGWTRLTGPAFYGSTAVASSKQGASLVKRGVRADWIGLVATTCPTCGSVAVYLGDRRLKTISLESSTTRHGVVLRVRDLYWSRTGTLTIRVVSSGRRVVIEGVVIRNLPDSRFYASATTAQIVEAAEAGEVHAIQAR